MQNETDKFDIVATGRAFTLCEWLFTQVELQ